MSIATWAEEDRPREKFQLKGRHSLSNAELLAIVIGSGNRNESAVELAKRILSFVNNELNALAKLSLKDLQKFKGVGEAKAISISAAIELGRRRNSQAPKILGKIVSSQEAYNEMKASFIDLDHEQFWILLLNRANKVITKKCISIGGIAGTVVDAKLIFKTALDHLASGIILFHNHPSGNLKPSQQDLSITKKLMEGARSLDINILDHVIISDLGYYSFKDEGQI